MFRLSRVPNNSSRKENVRVPSRDGSTSALHFHFSVSRISMAVISRIHLTSPCSSSWNANVHSTNRIQLADAPQKATVIPECVANRNAWPRAKLKVIPSTTVLLRIDFQQRVETFNSLRTIRTNRMHSLLSIYFNN